jgi:hypothetical protein
MGKNNKTTVMLLKKHYSKTIKDRKFFKELLQESEYIIDLSMRLNEFIKGDLN